MRAAWEALGWSGLTPSEQLSAASGAAAMLGLVLTARAGARAVFGGLRLPRRSRAKPKGKARKGRRR
jgi:hypothetical protein